MHPDPTPEKRYCIKFNSKVKSLVGTFDDKLHKCLGALLHTLPLDSRPGWARLYLDGFDYIEFAFQFIRGDRGEIILDKRSRLPTLYVAHYREGSLLSDAKKQLYSGLGWAGRVVGVISAVYGAWTLLDTFLAR